LAPLLSWAEQELDELQRFISDMVPAVPSSVIGRNRSALLGDKKSKVPFPE